MLHPLDGTAGSAGAAVRPGLCRRPGDTGTVPVVNYIAQELVCSGKVKIRLIQD